MMTHAGSSRSTSRSGNRDSGSKPGQWVREVSPDDVQEERRRLVLEPRKAVDTGVSTTPTALNPRKPSPFGAARPREVILAERQSESKKGSIPESLALSNLDPDRPQPGGERTLEEAKAAFLKAAAKLNPSHLADFLVELEQEFLVPVSWLRLATFLDYLDSAFSGVSLLWGDIFKEPVWSNLFDVSQIPEPFYEESAKWINRRLPDNVVRTFILWSFCYIMTDMFVRPCERGDPPIQKSNVSIFVALAMVLRSRSKVLATVLPSLRRKQLWYQEKDAVSSPITVWMIYQASHNNLQVGLYSWSHHVLPLSQLPDSDAQSKNLMLQLVEKIWEKQGAKYKHVNAPDLHGDPLIPPPSFEILLRLTFPASSARDEATTRFEKIYGLLKEVALAGASESEAVIEEMFTLSLRLSGEGNPDLANEATKIAIWSLTKNIVCWKRWNYLYNENLEASVALLKTLVEKFKDHSLKLSSSSLSDTLGGASESEAVIEQIFTLSLRLSGEGHPFVAKEATAIAIWCFTENVNLSKNWDYLYKKNPKASVALLKKLLEKWKDHSLKLSSSPSDTLAGAPESEAMKQVTQKIFTSFLSFAEEGNPLLPKQDTAIAIWCLTEIIDCCKYWDNLYEVNLEASIDLLKKLVEKMDHSLKLSSSLPSDPLGDASESEAMKQFTQVIFTFSLRLAGEGKSVLAKEATAIAIWSLIKNVDLWKKWDNLYKENLKASVALLKKLVDEWKEHSLKLSSSPSDSLTLTQTIDSFRLKNKNAITEGGDKGSLHREADKSCKVISRRLSRGSSSLKGTCIIALVLVTVVAVAAAAAPVYLRVFCFYK